MGINLEIISNEIREILEEKRKNLQLTFEEEKHKYSMLDLDGNLRDDWSSVSKIMKLFYEPFDTDGIAEKKSRGDLYEKERLIKEWAEAGTYSTNTGSRVHYFLEKKCVNLFGLDKEVRQPIFECDDTQITKSEMMIEGGTNFLNLMKERGAVLLDTEIVLGNPKLGYVGQGDNCWIIENKEKTECGFIITDYKTNKPKNFKENNFTKRMYEPFEKLPDTQLGHYFTQLPFYGKLLLKMLEGTKYDKLKLYGCIIVHLIDDGTFQEYRVPREVINTVLKMDMKKYLKNSK
jgi:hypothetical protein